jgi:EmrB/QacA subfamily drug resistance transporter
MVLFEGENRREKIIVLLTMCFALFMAMLDNTVVNVALPTLSRKLGAGVSGLQWIVDGYVLALASLLLTGGILGDRYGRKRMFLTGLAGFTFASLLCGLSQSTGQLIAFRALQGISASLLLPGTLSIITVTFPPQERAKAIGIWAGVSAFALALGPTVGGWMVEHAGWQSVFFLNVPIGIVGMVTGIQTIRESRAPHARRLDLPGLLLGTAGLFCLTYGLIEANQLGWGDPAIVGSLVLAAVFLGAFVAYERRAREPMMRLDLFKIPAFSAGNLVAFAVSLGMFGSMFFLSLYMQLIRGYGAFPAGLRILPMTGMVIFAAPNAGRLASKYGSKWPMVAGLSMATAGMFLMSRVGATTPYPYMIPIMMLMGLGVGSTMTPMTAAVMNAVGHERAGLGSATTNTSREVGGVFGIALLGTLLTTQLKSALTPKLAALGLTAAQQSLIVSAAGHGTLNGSQLGNVSPELAGTIRRAFSDSFMSGLHLSLMVGALIVFVAAVVTYRWIPAGAPQREDFHAVPATEPVPAR